MQSFTAIQRRMPTTVMYVHMDRYQRKWRPAYRVDIKPRGGHRIPMKTTKRDAERERKRKQGLSSHSLPTCLIVIAIWRVSSCALFLFTPTAFLFYTRCPPTNDRKEKKFIYGRLIIYHSKHAGSPERLIFIIVFSWTRSASILLWDEVLQDTLTIH